MAHSLIEINGHCARINTKQFSCTDVSDIAKLPRNGIHGTADVSDVDNEPCAIGSTCIVKTGEVYMLWPDNTWGEL